MGSRHEIINDFQRKNFLVFADELMSKNDVVVFEYKVGRKRTRQQNKSLHKFCRMIAESLNDAGFFMTLTSDFFKRPIEVPFTEDAVKESIWRPVQKAMFKTTSTKQLDTKQVGEIADVISLHLAEKFQMSVSFPSVEEELF